jgi:cytochrome P450
VNDDLLLAPSGLSREIDEERRERFPLGADLTLDDLGSADLASLTARLRESEPISWVPSLGGWFISSHELARQLLRPRPEFTVLSQQNMVRASLGRMMLTTDGEEHDRLRAPFEEPFRPKDIAQRFSHTIDRLARGLLDQTEGLESIDLDTDYAAPFAVGMAAELLGLNLGDAGDIADYYEAFADAMQYDENPGRLLRAEEARAALNAILLRSLDQADAESFVAAARRQCGDRVSLDEFIAQLRVIMFGAIETIRATVLNAVVLCHHEPAIREQLRRDPSVATTVVAEAQRLVPPVAFVERWARERVTLGAASIEATEFIGVSVVGANRDPLVFPEPDRASLQRDNLTRALTFSFGEHHCLGFHLARLQGARALLAVEERLGEWQLLEAPAAEGFAFRRPAVVRLARKGA